MDSTISKDTQSLTLQAEHDPRGCCSGACKSGFSAGCCQRPSHHHGDCCAGHGSCCNGNSHHFGAGSCCGGHHWSKCGSVHAQTPSSCCSARQEWACYLPSHGCSCCKYQAHVGVKDCCFKNCCPCKGGNDCRCKNCLSGDDGNKSCKCPVEADGRKSCCNDCKCDDDCCSKDGKKTIKDGAE